MPGGTFALLMTEGGPPLQVRALRSILRALPRGRYRVLGAVAPTRGRFVAELAADAGGARFACDLGDQISREACMTGLYEPPMTRVMQHHLPAGGTAVDLGANWGYFSLLAAASVGPAGSVLALEPDPAAVRRLVAQRDPERFRARDAAAGGGVVTRRTRQPRRL